MRNIRRSPGIRRSAVPRRKPRKESTPLGDGADDDIRTATEIADGSSDDRRYRSRRNPPRSRVCNCFDYIPHWEETLDRL